MTVLQKILENKRREVAELRSLRPLADLKKEAADCSPPKDFAGALSRPGLSVIAEIKKASPSRGRLHTESSHRTLAREYETGGAAALSVLTDRAFFQGGPEVLQEITRQSPLPALRKDFIIDEAQVYESRILGADAILLIVRILPPELLRRLHDLGKSLGMAVMVEVHTRHEVEDANSLGASIIGINNRDLEDFSVSLDQSFQLRPLLHPRAIAVSESGIKGGEEVRLLMEVKFDAVLIGEALVESKDRVATLRGIHSVTLRKTGFSQ
ncbi:MAG: indole-3-glycerol phosphate synthase TrpC [Ignavibacteriales bacterium]|nr:indole-3-glycerol phosphate synthase TrpC [Ignavibacteriales bacterium]